MGAGCATSAPEPGYGTCGHRSGEAFSYWTQIVVDAGSPGTVASLGYDWKKIAAAVEYPEFARRAGIEGRVRAEVVVDTTGRVVALRVRPTPGPTQLLVDAAFLGLRDAEFFPAPPFLDAVELDVSFRLR